MQDFGATTYLQLELNQAISMGSLLGITGTPGTGKKSVAPLVARALGVQYASLNSLALASGCIEKAADGLEVDTRLLRKAIKGRSRDGVIQGHLIPDVFRGDELERVCVLRCDPSSLKRRLLARGYDGARLRENVEAELIGLVLADSIASFGRARTYEYDTTDSKAESVVTSILRDLESGKRRSAHWIDWTTAYASAPALRALFSSR